MSDFSQHAQEHAEIARAQAAAHDRWREMTRSERRRALRRKQRATRRAYARAHAAAGEPSEVGSWEPPFVTASNYKGYAVHAALLHTGKILMWGEEGGTLKKLTLGADTYAWLWDPTRGQGPDAFKDVTPRDSSGISIPIYCSGLSFLPDGRLLAVGGTLAWGDESPDDEYDGLAGLNKAVVFDPATETWTEIPRPAAADGRWYPTQVLLPDGRTLVMAGVSDDAPGKVMNKESEIYDPVTNTFTVLEGETQLRSMENYPHLFTLPDGDVLMAGPGRSDSALFDPENLNDPWTDLPRLPSQRYGGNGVLMPEGPDGSSRVALIGGGVYMGPVDQTNTVLDAAAGQWSSFPSLGTQRFHANTVLLPDRSMVTIGGDAIEKLRPARGVELYDPATRTWRVGPSQVETRAYHSTALLLPDGRVLSAGDDRNPTTGPLAEPSPIDTAEIYSPPYLFAGPRPAISSAPEALPWDVPFSIETKGDIDDAVLIAPAAVTHANDMSQRLVPLTTAREHEGGVTLQSPPSAGVAPPGWYMLFVLDDGVPSVAKWVRLDGAAPAPDVAAPRLKLKFERNWLDRLQRNGRLRLRATLDERATVDFSLLRGKHRIARARRKLAAGRHRIQLRLTRGALRSLRRASTPRLRVSAVAVDVAANETAWTGRLRPALGR